ncbi:hypothetical protein ElyMa_002694400 [Elysia marginata]|uniref:SRCR domain-containing protein n=1 Tax=Elysia marginata TaxID=1093978 RepID=A0AAV4HBY8_9GAST|nr:hypothetical protein ElyMa_002694400 [Elysia marginata]
MSIQVGIDAISGFRTPRLVYKHPKLRARHGGKSGDSLILFGPERLRPLSLIRHNPKRYGHRDTDPNGYNCDEQSEYEQPRHHRATNRVEKYTATPATEDSTDATTTTLTCDKKIGYANATLLCQDLQQRFMITLLHTNAATLVRNNSIGYNLDNLIGYEPCDLNLQRPEWLHPRRHWLTTTRVVTSTATRAHNDPSSYVHGDASPQRVDTYTRG